MRAGAPVPLLPLLTFIWSCVTPSETAPCRCSFRGAYEHMPWTHLSKRALCLSSGAPSWQLECSRFSSTSLSPSPLFHPPLPILITQPLHFLRVDFTFLPGFSTPSPSSPFACFRECLFYLQSCWVLLPFFSFKCSFDHFIL